MAWRFNFAVVGIGSGAWIAFLSLIGSMGLFLPLIVSSIMIPAVVAGLVDAPAFARPFLSCIPSLLACATIVLALPRYGSDWHALILELIAGGAALVAAWFLVLALWRSLWARLVEVRRDA